MIDSERTVKILGRQQGGVRKTEIRCLLRWMNDIKLDLEENGWKQWASVI
jgi:hypothetical protein